MPENKNKNRSTIELRSEAVQEILGRVPHWMIRWGNSVISILVIGVLFLSYIIKYPNTITAEVLVTTSNPTQNTYAPTTGNLSSVMVKDGQIVEKNELLATLSVDETDESIRAYSAGHVYFVNFWKTGFQVEKGDLMFRIIPTEYGSFIGRLKIPNRLKTKIEEGDKVRIRLSKDQLMEYEILEGVVQNFTSVTNEKGTVQVEISIGSELISATGKKIDYQLGMLGTADIITEDLRLIERFFYLLKDVFKD